MDIQIGYRPAQALARVILDNGEQIRAESGAMVGMSTNVHMETGMTGGMMGGLKRMFGGESFFQNTFTAQGGQGEVLLAHSLCGDIVNLEMSPQGFFIQSSSYIASSPWVNCETKVGGFKSFFGVIKSFYSVSQISRTACFAVSKALIVSSRTLIFAG